MISARESGDVFAIDASGGVYRLGSNGRVGAVSRGLHYARLTCWCDIANAFKSYSCSQGIKYVMQNGHMVVDRGRSLGCLAGKIIKRQSIETKLAS